MRDKSSPPKPGDTVWYADKKEAWRTGKFIKVIERGKYFGLCIIEDSVSKSNKKVLPEWIRPINTGGRS